MPRTYKGLYPQMYDFAHLYEAYRRARRGKRRRPDVAAFEFRFEEQLLQLADSNRQMLNWQKCASICGWGTICT